MIINIKASDIIYYDKHWNTEWLTMTDNRTGDSAVSEIENRHHL